MDGRFYDIAWAKVKDGRGIIAGALENGSLDLWDADKLSSNERYAWSYPVEHRGMPDSGIAMLLCHGLRNTAALSNHYSSTRFDPS